MKALLPALIAATAAAVVGTADSAEPAKTGPQSDAQAPVAVVRAANACFTATIRVTGFLVARQEAIVNLDAPGMKISEVLVDEGDRVTSGQRLARLTRLSTEGPDPTAGKSGADVVKAPAGGIITRSTAMVGMTGPLMPPEPLFRIAVDGEIELEAEVPSSQVPSLAAGQTARIEIGGNRELAGRVRLVPAIIDQKRQLGRARVSLERAPSLRLGTFASATIDAKRSCGISVPSSAVEHRTEGTSVLVVRDDVIERRRVQVGLHSSTDTEIRDGLRESEMVVANAGGSLRDGDKVKAVLSDAAKAEQR